MIENVRYENAGQTTISATIDGMTYSGIPASLEKTFKRHPYTDEVTEEFYWSSGNRFRQMIADEYENKGIDIPVFVPDPIHINQIKAEAAKRIEQILPTWMAIRAISGGSDISQDIKDAAQRIRDASNALEQMNPIPQDYTDDKYW